MKRHFLFTLLACIAIVAKAANPVLVDGLYFQIKDGTASVIKSTEDNPYTGAIVIPEQIEVNETPYTVTAVGNDAFKGVTGVTSVSFPSTINSIGTNAFQNCTGLTMVTFASVEDFCHVSYAGTLSHPLNSGKVELSFADGSDVTNLTIPGTVGTINNNAFYGCFQLKNLVLAEGITSIGQAAFNGCTSLTSVTIPSTVTIINSSAFAGCNSLTKAVYASVLSLCSIDYKAENSNPLTFANHLFIGNKEIFEVSIPSESLDNGNTIRSYMFCGAKYLTGVTIPTEAVRVGIDAFKNCFALQFVSFSSITQVNDMVYENENSNPLKYAKNLIAGGQYIYSLTIDKDITDYAFLNAQWLKKVELGPGVQRIGESAFSGCSNLKEIDFSGSNVNFIGSSAFKNCILESVEIPENCVIGTYLFNSCRSLVKATLPSSMHDIPDGTFFNCTALRNITFSTELTSIGEQAFYSCDKLSALPAIDEVKTIGKSAFENCTGFSNIFLGDDKTGKVETIYDKAFKNCKNATMVSLPKTVNYIFTEAFADCGKLREVYSHRESVPTTDKDAFGGNENAMTHYVINEVAESNYSSGGIPWSNFKKTIVKTECTLSFYINNVKREDWDLTLYSGNIIPADSIAKRMPELGEGETFSGWDKDIPQTMPSEDMRFDGYITTEKYFGDLKFQLLPQRTEKGKVLEPRAVLVGVKKLEKDKDLIVPASVTGNDEVVYPVTEIGENGTDCNEEPGSEWKKHIKSVQLPASIKVIGASAFIDCKGLEDINIPEGVDSIGDYAFKNCYMLTSISIPNSARVIGKGAFSWCTGLEVVENFNLTEIADETFYGCRNLLSVNLNQVETLGDAALANCSQLALEELPVGLKAIGNQALSGTGISKATIKSAIVSMGEEAFKNCTKLDTVIFEAGYAKPLPGKTFWGCTALKHFALADGMERVGEGAFKECTSLSVITEEMLKGISTIGPEAFMGCSKLTTVTLPASLTRLASKAFAGCDTLIHVFALGDNVPVSSSDAFSEKTYNNSNAYVYVNDETAVEKYKAAEPWKNFKNGDGTYRIIVARDFKLTYKVNDEDYQVFDVMVGTPIEVLEEPKDPKREDRPFSGWFTMTEDGMTGALPGVMPQRDTVIVGKFKYEVKFYEGEPMDDDSNRLLTGEDHEDGIWCWYGDTYKLPVEELKKEDKRFTIVLPDGTTLSEEEAADYNVVIKAADLSIIVNYEDVVAEMEDKDNGITYKIMMLEDMAAVKEIGQIKKDVTIPATIEYDGKNYPVKTIMANAAINNKTLESIVLNEVTTIGDHAFYKCLNLKEIKGGLSKVDSIGDNAFCNTLFTKVDVPSNVTRMGKSVFYGCSRLEEVLVSTENIREETFSKCGSYSSTGELIVTLDGVKTIGDKAFDGCGRIKKLTLPASVTAIGEYAFDHVFETGDVIEVLAAADAFPAIFENTFDEDAYKEAELRTQKAISHDDLSGVWKNFVNIEEIVEAGANQCEPPTISYEGNRLTLASKEEGATIFYTIKALDDQSTSYNPETDITLSKQFVVTAYAKKSGMRSSDTVSETFRFDTIIYDLNEDGHIDVADVQRLIKVIAEK